MRIGLYCYAWDFADQGVETLLGWCAENGITDLFLAASYHTGWFLHGHNSKRKAYMAPSGSVYFHPHREYYGLLQPCVAGMCVEHDYFREITEKAELYGLRVTAWTVGAHNTRLGLLHPECCVTNCFGDVYPHALCPSHPEVWCYLMALCRDIAAHFPVSALQLESFCYEGWKHDHQHERDFYGLAPLENELMGLCFNTATMAGAQTRGVDVELVRAGVVELLQGVFQCAPERPPGHPRTWEEAEAQIPGLAAYRDYMMATDENILVAASEAMAPTLCHNLTSSTLGAYGKTPEFVRQNIGSAREAAGQQPLWLASLLGAEQIPSQEFLTELVSVARRGGADGLVFYNYSESPRRVLDWMRIAVLNE